MGFKLSNNNSSKLRNIHRGKYIPPQYLIYASIPKISTPYLLLIGDVSIGNYKIITYATEEEAKKQQIKEIKKGGLTKILKAFPVKKTNMLKKIEGHAVCITTDKDNGLFKLLSENDIFLGSNPEIQLNYARKRKKEYITNLRGEKNPVYGMFRPDQVIISALVNVN